MQRFLKRHVHNGHFTTAQAQNIPDNAGYFLHIQIFNDPAWLDLSAQGMEQFIEFVFTLAAQQQRLCEKRKIARDGW